jgi:hypothetical protein
MRGAPNFRAKHERLKIPSAAEGGPAGESAKLQAATSDHDRSIDRNVRDFKLLRLGQPCCDAHIMVLKDVSRRGNESKRQSMPKKAPMLQPPCWW